MRGAWADIRRGWDGPADRRRIGTVLISVPTAIVYVVGSLAIGREAAALISVPLFVAGRLWIAGHWAPKETDRAQPDGEKNA